MDMPLPLFLQLDFDVFRQSFSPRTDRTRTSISDVPQQFSALVTVRSSILEVPAEEHDSIVAHWKTIPLYENSVWVKLQPPTLCRAYVAPQCLASIALGL